MNELERERKMHKIRALLVVHNLYLKKIYVKCRERGSKKKLILQVIKIMK